MRSFYLSCLCCLLTVFSATAQELKSPDGRFKLIFKVNKGIPVYTLSYKGTTVIAESKLGFNTNVPMGSDFKVSNSSTSAKNDIWKPVLGQQKEIRDLHTELFVHLVQAGTNRVMDIRFRLFNDGLGFRYEFPVQPSLRHFTIKEELTEFNLAKDYKAFWLPSDYDTNEFPTTTSQLSEVAKLIDIVRKESLAAKAPSATLAVQTPLMLKSDNGIYINIHEAALVNFPAMHLNLDDQHFILSANLAPDAKGNRGYIQTGTTSPWRTVIVSDDARKILASNLILNLNAPCALDSTDWIHPVKYVGVWWEYFTGGGSTWAYSDNPDVIIGKTDFSKIKPNGHHGANTAHVKEYIDFAAKNGFDAVLVEGWNEGWEDNTAYVKENIYSFTNAYPDFNVEELHKYGAAKGVKIIMHHETTSSVSAYERQLEGALQFMKDNGYDGVKTGYVGPIQPHGEYHDGQYMVNHYLHVAKRAAAYHVMVDSHEAVRPTGLHRTYPNWFAQESARGTEFESFNGNRPDHTTILPFTRLIGGPMDYTPGIFQGDLSVYGGNNKATLSSTLVKQLALYVTMYSPLQMAADLPENYNKYADAFQFIKDVAVDWDATYVLEAEPGDYITIARKAKGKDEWYVGGITDENAREAVVKFDFLPAGRKFMATVYADAADADWRLNPRKYVINKVEVTSKTVMKQRLAPGGGVAVSVK
jgi:hypothetical protein